MRVHKLTFAALAVAASLSLTACQNDDDATGQSDPSAASSEASSGGGSGSGDSQQGAGDESGGEGTGGQGTAAGSGSGSGSGANDKVGKCRTDELKFKAMDATIDGDTEGTVAVELTNGGGRECAISGYAGVDLKTNSGTLSAKRSGEPVVPGTLKDGETVAFGIHYPINDSGGSGVRITGLVVTPPDETKSVTLDWPGAATLPVTDGTGSPVKVGPIGSAGQGG
ncbi:DUF4232 domain-containing protein [Streptomyces sp. NBC_01723]|uniref:DUF4232 domain-containing protein n=1 Tax=unclassified Streptomyces TaxID=2593676 RepID=UPI002784F3B6|nr:MULTISPECIES: DUF4232 domain-containing protein [unclassified Streptomyces]MDQ0401615.1 hypothetical protein [Streptomyces sp. DSM 40167]